MKGSLNTVTARNFGFKNEFSISVDFLTHTFEGLMMKRVITPESQVPETSGLELNVQLPYYYILHSQFKDLMMIRFNKAGFRFPVYS